MPLILYGELYTTYSEVTYNVIRKTEAVVDDKYLSILGDILIPTSGETPEEISRATCVMVPNVILAGDLLIFRPTKEVDGRILSFILNHKLNNKIASIAQGKSIVHIQASELCQLRVTFPTLPEQKKIASLLSSIDSTLNLCQRKLGLLTQAKKALMQQIFSQKLRFKADDGSEFPAWEEETVGDLFVFVSSKNTGNTIDNVITNSAEFGLIPQRDFFDKDIAVEGRTENYTIIHKGDFVYNPRKSTTAPYGPFNMYSREEVGIVSPLYTCLTPINSDSSDYLAWYFQTDRWFSYIVKNGAQGGARHDRVGMTNELMKKIPVQVPSLPEQKKIASCLSSADALIAQARAELKQWREVKKSLLQQMFV